MGIMQGPTVGTRSKAGDILTALTSGMKGMERNIEKEQLETLKTMELFLQLGIPPEDWPDPVLKAGNKFFHLWEQEGKDIVTPAVTKTVTGEVQEELTEQPTGPLEGPIETLEVTPEGKPYVERQKEWEETVHPSRSIATTQKRTIGGKEYHVPVGDAYEKQMTFGELAAQTGMTLSPGFNPDMTLYQAKQLGIDPLKTMQTPPTIAELQAELDAADANLLQAYQGDNASLVVMTYERREAARRKAQAIYPNESFALAGGEMSLTDTLKLHASGIEAPVMNPVTAMGQAVELESSIFGFAAQLAEADPDSAVAFLEEQNNLYATSTNPVFQMMAPVHIEDRQVMKIDEEGNPVKDDEGNPVYETRIGARTYLEQIQEDLQFGRLYNREKAILSLQSARMSLSRGGGRGAGAAGRPETMYDKVRWGQTRINDRKSIIDDNTALIASKLDMSWAQNPALLGATLTNMLTSREGLHTEWATAITLRANAYNEGLKDDVRTGRITEDDLRALWITDQMLGNAPPEGADKPLTIEDIIAGMGVKPEGEE
jgi:hypothetical protein